ncbi:hypothetical protein LSAT2_023402 [Lamellibrachia satsuma]|nr:hypothetical protein LSAT2_023402 [Lamellibrachia satsuma]
MKRRRETMWMLVVVGILSLAGSVFGGLTEDNFLLVYDRWSNTLRQLNLAENSATRIPLGHQDFRSPAYDPIETKVYWIRYREIKRADLNGTREETILREGQPHYYNYYWYSAIAIDAISRLVYYTSRTEDTQLNLNFIAAMTLDGHHRFLLVTTKGNYINGIALDPITRMMYWHSRYSIEAAAMDGSQHRSLVNQADYVTSLTIDSKETPTTTSSAPFAMPTVTATIPHSTPSANTATASGMMHV